LAPFGVLPRRTLGSSGIDVSVFALGSWRTYERISRDAGVAVLQQARASGINFLEIARYNDETGTAPVPTGYSEVVFGELLRRSGWPRDEVRIAEKLWWEFWPEQTAATELDASLRRTGLDHVDLLYSDPPPGALPLEEVVAAFGELIAAGKTRAWGIVNWPAARVADASRIAREQNVQLPCAAQLPYNLVQRDWVEGAPMTDALELCGASLVASYVLLGGVLTGKYARSEPGRMSGGPNAPQAEAGKRAVAPLVNLASELAVSPASLAIAFALANPRLATVLFGATQPEQIVENLRAVEVAASLSEAHLAELRAIGGRSAG
jgi:aryl-alcohol dehydrogenase-like predicted oxidoreductase